MSQHTIAMVSGTALASLIGALMIWWLSLNEGPIRRTGALGLTVMALTLGIAACGGPDAESSVRVVIADDQEASDGFNPGDPLTGGTVRLFAGDTLILEQLLADDGQTSFAVPTGRYTLQVFHESADAGCFWGNTLNEVEFPQSVVRVVAFYVCSG